MSHNDAVRMNCGNCSSRRSVLRAGVGLLALGAMDVFPREAMATPLDATVTRAEFRGGPVPSPIHSLDKNGHHNVPPGPYTEPSEILNFRGHVATGVTVGTARDNHGRRLTLGGSGTDVRLMQGEYVAADGKTHHGAFTHL